MKNILDAILNLNKIMLIEALFLIFSEKISLFGEVNSKLFLIPHSYIVKKVKGTKFVFNSISQIYSFLETLDRNSKLFTIFWAPKAAATPKECPWMC